MDSIGLMNMLLYRQKLLNDSVMNKLRELEMQVQLMNCLVAELKDISKYHDQPYFVAPENMKLPSSMVPDTSTVIQQLECDS